MEVQAHPGAVPMDALAYACLAVFEVEGAPELQNKKSIFVELEESEEIVTVNDLMKKASPGKFKKVPRVLRVLHTSDTPKCS